MVNFKELLGNDNQLQNLLLDIVEEMVKAIDDVVAKEKGAQISYDDEHHSIFAFEKCTVENHATVLNVSPYKVNIWISFLMP